MRQFIPLLLLLLAACAGSPDWVNPAVPRARWSQDLTTCRRAADDEVGLTDYYAPDDRSSLPSHMMAREDSNRRFDSYVAGCMQGLGYRRAR